MIITEIALNFLKPEIAIISRKPILINRQVL